MPKKTETSAIRNSGDAQGEHAGVQTHASAEELRAYWKWRSWNADSQLIISYHGSEENVRVPAFIGRRPVAAVGTLAFCTDRTACRYSDEVLNARKHVRSVTVEEGITELQEKAFALSNINQISLPESLLVIGSAAFWNCPLKSLTIPENVVWVGQFFASGCVHLKTLIVRGSETGLPFVRNGNLPNGLEVKAPLGSRAMYWAQEYHLSFTPLQR